jgi:hypothetical protein
MAGELPADSQGQEANREVKMKIPDGQKGDRTSASKAKSRVDLDKMRVEHEKFRESARTGANRGQITIRAVANIVENVHLEGMARGFRFESDEPAERGGTNLGPAPLSFFLMGAAF